MALTSLVLISRLFIISSLSSPYASSTVYFPFKCDNVVSVMWIFPGLPPDSIRLAIVTASDQTSNCHFFKPKTSNELCLGSIFAFYRVAVKLKILDLPRTPQWTRPEWIPTRIFNSDTPVTILTKFMVSIMSRPIWTAHEAWSGRASGRPETQ